MRMPSTRTSVSFWLAPFKVAVCESCSFLLHGKGRHGFDAENGTASPNLLLLANNPFAWPSDIPTYSWATATLEGKKLYGIYTTDGDLGSYLRSLLAIPKLTDPE